MKKLAICELEQVSGSGPWGCAASIVGSVAVTAGAVAVTGGAALAGWLLAKTAATLWIVDACDKRNW
ncbi:hypothetical protein [Haliscomenobacter sp.]|uniref:hypothetical protein n=1 Tax=Haliscomenobacter sp. TaxID=2717303 RepID=UPI00336507A4